MAQERSGRRQRGAHASRGRTERRRPTLMLAPRSSPRVAHCGRMQPPVDGACGVGFAAWQRAGSGSGATGSAGEGGTCGSNNQKPALLLAEVAAALMKRRLAFEASQKRTEKHVASMTRQQQGSQDVEPGSDVRRQRARAKVARPMREGTSAEGGVGRSGSSTARVGVGRGSGMCCSDGSTREGARGSPQGRLHLRQQQISECCSDSDHCDAGEESTNTVGPAEARLGGKGEEASSGNGEEKDSEAPGFPSVALPLLATLLGSAADVASAMCVNREWHHSLTHSLRSFSLLFDPNTLSWLPSFHDPSSLPLMRQWTPAALHPPLLDPLPLPPPSLRLCAHGGCASCASGSTSWCSGGSSSSRSSSSGGSEYRSRWGEMLSLIVLHREHNKPFPFPCSTAVKPGSASSWKHTLSHYPNLTSLHLPLLSTPPWSGRNANPQHTRYPLPRDVVYSPSDISTLFNSIGQLPCSKTLRCVQVQVGLDMRSRQLTLSSPHVWTDADERDWRFPQLYHMRMEKQTLETQERDMERGVQSLLQACPNLRALHLQGRNLHCCLSLSPSTLASFSLLTHLSLPLPGAIPPPLLRLPRLVSLSLSLSLQTDAALSVFHHQMRTPALFHRLPSLSSLTLIALRNKYPLRSSSQADMSRELFQGLEGGLCSLTLLLLNARIRAPTASSLHSLWTLSRLTHLHTDLHPTHFFHPSTPSTLSLPLANSIAGSPPLSPRGHPMCAPLLLLPSLSRLTSLSLPSLTFLPSSLSLLSCLSRLEVPWVTVDSDDVISSLPRLTHLECATSHLHHIMDLGPSPSCRPCCCHLHVPCDCCDCQGHEESSSSSGHSSCSVSSSSSSSSSRCGGSDTPFRHCSCLHPSEAPGSSGRGLVSLVLHGILSHIAHTTHAHAHCYPTLHHLELHGVSSLHWLWSARPVPPPFSLFPNLHTLICTPLVRGLDTTPPADVDLGFLPSLARVSGTFKLRRADVALYPSLHTAALYAFQADPLGVWQSVQHLKSLRTLILSHGFATHQSLYHALSHLKRSPLAHLTALHTLHLPLCCDDDSRQLDSLATDWPAHLRCLRLVTSRLSAVPESVLGCWQLEELHLIAWPYLKALPAGLAGMRRLRVVRVSGCEEAPLVPAALLPLLKGQRWHVPFSQSMACDW